VPDPSDEVAVVVDASVVVDLLAGKKRLADSARSVLADRRMIAPAHLDAEVLSALGRLQRAGVLTIREVTHRLSLCEAAPIERRPVAELLVGAWRRRNDYRLTDGLYVELAERLDLALVTSDRRLGRRYPRAEIVDPSS